MRNDFPRTEAVVFEEVYGQRRSEAFPHRSGSVFNMRDTQKVICAQRNTKHSKSVFSDTKLAQIEREILNRAGSGYLSLSHLADLEHSIEDLSFVYKILEQRKVINVDHVVEDIPRQKKGVFGKVWTKKETLKLLEAIDTHGDDWAKVGEIVGRSRADCILRFLKMDFGLGKLITANKEMAQVVFLASRVHPRVGSAAAKEFIMTYGREPNWDNVVKKAKEQAELEEAKIKRLEQVILESEIMKLKLKVLDYKQMAGSIDKEKAEIRENILDHRKRIQDLAEVIRETEDV